MAQFFRAVRARLTRKNDAASDLRYKLAQIINEDKSKNEVQLRRVRLGWYQEVLQETMLDKVPKASVKPARMGALYYARFHSLYNMATHSSEMKTQYRGKVYGCY